MVYSNIVHHKDIYVGQALYKDACIVNISKFNIMLFNFRLMRPHLPQGQREQGMLRTFLSKM